MYLLHIKSKYGLLYLDFFNILLIEYSSIFFLFFSDKKLNLPYNFIKYK